MAIKRIEINYWDGVNRNVAPFLSKKNELYRAENVRSDRAGLLEKRGGTRRLGDDIGATHNFGLHHFQDTNVLSNKFYRVSKVGDVVSIYYLNTSSNWTALTSYGTGLCLLGDSSAQFDITNPSGTKFRYTWDGTGGDPTITSKVYIGDELIINAQNFNTVNNGTFIIIDVGTNYFDITNASGIVESNKTIGTGSIIIKSTIFDFANVKTPCYIVNLRDNNRVLQEGSTVSLTAYSFNSAPIAERIRYYKNRLYVANYRVGSVRFKNGVAFSSPPVGIVSLVDGDHESGSYYRNLGGSTTQFDITNTAGSTYRYTYDGTGTDPLITTYVSVGSRLSISDTNLASGNEGKFTVTAVNTNYFEVTNASGVVESNKNIDIGYITILGNISVTDTKYIKSADASLYIYRAGTLIITITVDSKTEETIRVSDASSPSGAINPYVNLKSGDEIWATTIGGERIFRWASNPITGTDVKRYDTFEIPCVGPDDNEIIMQEVVGNILVYGTKNNLAYFNESSLTSLNNDIGCCSKKGFVKSKGVLFLIHYSGIYSISGASAPQIISTPIEQYISGATKAGLEGAVASKRGYSVLFYIGDVTLYNIDGSIEKEVSDVTLEYDIRKQNWYVHTGIEMSHYATYVSSSDIDRLIYADPTDGEVFQMFFGTSDKEVTSNIAIPMMATTHPIYLGQTFDKYAYPVEFIIEVLRGTNIKVFASLDDGHFFEIGEANKGINRIIIRGMDESSGQSNYPVKCRKINISFRESSTKGVIIGRTALEYAESLEDIQKIET